MPHKSLAGHRVLVTGGATGIGAAIALQFAEAGADVAIDYLDNPDAAAEVSDGIRQAGVQALAVQANVADPAAVAKLFERLDREWGGVDILVNNAGTDGHAASGWQCRLDDWRAVIEVNLFGTFHCAREALRRMVDARAGVVINISSVHENIPWSGYSAYTASKAAVSMLTKTLAQECAPFGVRVLAVGPGAIKTNINRSVWSDAAGLADIERKIPMRRMGDPQ